jgi:hypothetical protein
VRCFELFDFSCVTFLRPVKNMILIFNWNDRYKVPTFSHEPRLFGFFTSGNGFTPCCYARGTTEVTEHR